VALYKCSWIESSRRRAWCSECSRPAHPHGFPSASVVILRVSNSLQSVSETVLVLCITVGRSIATEMHHLHWNNQSPAIAHCFVTCSVMCFDYLSGECSVGGMHSQQERSSHEDSDAVDHRMNTGQWHVDGTDIGTQHTALSLDSTWWVVRV
jgi:hypothetical protein